MKFALLVVIVLQTSCTVVGGFIGGVAAHDHNARRPKPALTMPASYEAPACAQYRREREAAAMQETDPARRALALDALPNCVVRYPQRPEETFDPRNVGLWVLGGLAVGFAGDLSLLWLWGHYVLADSSAD